MIEARNLSKRYEDNVLALDDLNLRVNPGEIYCLLGANGAGKTTTINIFLAFIEPTSGQALLNDIDAARNPLQAKEYVAYVSENVMLYGNFTARQNLDFFARLGGKRNLRKDDYYQAMQKVGLPEKAFEQRVREFSKGCDRNWESRSQSSRMLRHCSSTSPRRDWIPRPGRSFSRL